MDLQLLQSLRKLSIGACETDVCDLTGGTQISSLALTWKCSLPRHFLLPIGSDAQLQHFFSSCQYRFDSYQELQNLQADASQLTYLDFACAYPDNFDLIGWPASMPHLDTKQLAIMRV